MNDGRDLVGVPFQSLGRTPEQGLDCWGLVMYVYREYLGIELTDYRIDAYNNVAISDRVGHAVDCGWRAVPSRTMLARHDLVTFRLDVSRAPQLTTHVGLWLADGCRFLHAMTRTGVVVSRLDEPFWQARTSGYLTWIGRE